MGEDIQWGLTFKQADGRPLISREPGFFRATSLSRDGQNFGVVEATAAPPSFCYSLQVTNRDSEEDSVFASIDLPMATPGETTARMTLTVDLLDTNGDGLAYLMGLVPEAGLQQVYIHRWRAPMTTDTRLGGRDLGTPIIQPGTYSFELGTTTAVRGPTFADANVMSGVLNVRLSPGDTIRVSGMAVLDDGSGGQMCAMPEPPGAQATPRPKSLHEGC